MRDPSATALADLDARCGPGDGLEGLPEACPSGPPPEPLRNRLQAPANRGPAAPPPSRYLSATACCHCGGPEGTLGRALLPIGPRGAVAAVHHACFPAWLAARRAARTRET